MNLYVTFDGQSGAGKGTLISWLEQRLALAGRRVVVLQNKRADPLRQYSANMLPWCEKRNLNRNAFMVPLFAAGAAMTEPLIAYLLSEYEVVLRDRSFVSALAYTPASDSFSAEAVWDLYVNHLNCRVPDCAVIVDAPVDIALERIALRDQKETGLGGKMSGDVAHRKRIRRHFLEIPKRFAGRMDVLVAENNASPIGDDLREEAIRTAGLAVVGHLRKKGVISWPIP